MPVRSWPREREDPCSSVLSCAAAACLFHALRPRRPACALARQQRRLGSPSFTPYRTAKGRPSATSLDSDAACRWIGAAKAQVRHPHAPPIRLPRRHCGRVTDPRVGRHVRRVARTQAAGLPPRMSCRAKLLQSGWRRAAGAGGRFRRRKFLRRPRNPHDLVCNVHDFFTICSLASREL